MQYNNDADIHRILKDATSSPHHKLDSLPCMQQLMSASLTFSDYTKVLRVMYHWYKDAEAKIQQFIDLKTHLPFMIDKSQLISNDLKQLSEIEASVSISSINFKLSNKNLIKIKDFHQALGLVYVVEGSTLGGLVLSPKIKKTFNNKQVTGFYDCYGEHKRHNFQETLKFINDCVECESHIHHIIEGALQAFTSLHDCLLTMTPNQEG